MGEFLNKEGLTRFKQNMLTEVDKRIASGGGSSSSGDVPTKEEIIEGATRVTDVEVSSEVATVEALQTGLARVEASYLPLSGGTIPTDHAIRFGEAEEMKVFVDANGDFIIGASSSNASLIRLRATTSLTNQGGFQIRAKNSTDATYLFGFPDGRLTWDDKEVERVNSSGDYWVCYESGLMLCSGDLTLTKSADTVVTFPVPFVTNPKVIVSRSSGASTTTNYPLWVRGITTTYCNVYSSASTGCFWIAMGRWK